MIVELWSIPFIILINGIISIMPTFDSLPSSFTDTISLLLKAMNFFPSDVWIMVIGNILFWTGIHFLVGLIKFILGFIPTMDGG